MKRGRKRKPGARHPCGKLTRQETKREAMATVIAARRRHHGVTAVQARDERLGTAFGRLAYQRLISEAQYQAGLAFAELYQRHHIAMGLPLPSAASIAGRLINEGIFGSSPSEPLLDALDRLRQRFEAATAAIDASDREQRMSRGRRPSLLLYRVVCADEDTTLWSETDLGNLRVAQCAGVGV